MSVYYPSGNCGGAAIPDYTCSPCGSSYEYGRIRSIAFVKSNYSIADPSNPTQWNTAIATGNAIVIWATSGNYDSATEELVGFGDAETVNGGITHTLVYKDPNVQVDNAQGNCDFYNAIKDSSEYTVYFRTSSRLWAANAPVTISPKMPVADDLKSVLTYEVTVKWQNSSLPCSSAVPDGIFDTCYVPV